MKKTLIAIAFFIAANATFAQTQKPVVVKKSTTSVKYTCPMHKQIVRNKPGKCPICGMKLVKRK